MNAAVRNRLAVLAIGLAALGLAVVAWWWAEDRLRVEQHRLAEDRLRRAFPLTYDNDLYRDRLTFSEIKEWRQSVPLFCYVFRRTGRFIGVVLTPVIVRGYQSDISLAVGIGRDGAVTGVIVLSHGETAGLGDGIIREPFLGQWRGAVFDTDRQWNLRRDDGAYDGVSGATISSRAVIHAIRDSLRFYAGERSRWAGTDTPGGPSSR